MPLPVIIITKRPGASRKQLSRDDEINEEQRQVLCNNANMISSSFASSSSSSSSVGNIKPNISRPSKALAAIDPLRSLGFPAKLHAMLSCKDINLFVSWMPHGRAWRVHKPKLFETTLLPKFFVKCTYASFLRQVIGWGFRRITQGPDRNSYYNIFFVRGCYQLCQQMRRVPVGQKNKKYLEPIPNFYHMDAPPEIEDILEGILDFSDRSKEGKPLKPVQVTAGFSDISDNGNNASKPDQKTGMSSLIKPCFPVEKNVHKISGSLHESEIVDGNQEFNNRTMHRRCIQNQVSSTGSNPHDRYFIPPVQQKSPLILSASTNFTHQRQNTQYSNFLKTQQMKSKVWAMPAVRVPESGRLIQPAGNDMVAGLKCNSNVEENPNASKRLKELMDLSEYFRSRRGD